MCERLTWKQSELQKKSSQFTMDLAKFKEVLYFLNKRKQIFKITIKIFNFRKPFLVKTFFKIGSLNVFSTEPTSCYHILKFQGLETSKTTVKNK